MRQQVELAQDLEMQGRVDELDDVEAVFNLLPALRIPLVFAVLTESSKPVRYQRIGQTHLELLQTRVCHFKSAEVCTAECNVAQLVLKTFK